MASLSTREPLAIRAAVVAAIQVLITTAVSFGAPLDVEQIGALNTATATLSILAVVLWSRGKVTPEEVVQERIQEAEAAAAYVGEHRAEHRPDW